MSLWLLKFYKDVILDNIRYIDKLNTEIAGASNPRADEFAQDAKRAIEVFESANVEFQRVIDKYERTDA